MWKPIQSAPKDGTRILVKNSSISNSTPHIAAYTYYDNCFRDVWDTNLKLEDVTHWHPIPLDDSMAYGTNSIALGPDGKANIYDSVYDASLSVNLLNWINLINTTVCLLPDVKNETVQTLVDARNKVIK